METFKQSERAASEIRAERLHARFRVMTAEDIPAGVRLKDIAGWNQTDRDWERFLCASPEGCFVAEHEDRVIGTSATIIYEARLAWIGMLLVDREHRGRGIGTALLEHSLRYLDSRGVPSVKLDATPQGRPLYEKLGFTAEYEIERWMLKRSPRTEVVRKADLEIEDVLRLDRGIFGADRSGLLRSVAAAAPGFALAVRQSSEIDGYIFGRHGSLADQLGPWMARDESTAAILLDEFLQRSGRECVFVDCVPRHAWAVRLLQDRGFEFSRPLTRMVRGTNDYAGQPDLMCAIVGPEFG